MPDKIEDAVQELMQENSVSYSEALFIYWVKVGKKYVSEIQESNDLTDTIDSAVEALEENLHNEFA